MSELSVQMVLENVVKDYEVFLYAAIWTRMYWRFLKRRGEIYWNCGKLVDCIIFHVRLRMTSSGNWGPYYTYISKSSKMPNPQFK